ncbi:MAG: NrsF family protein [Paracoccaceae bacterium]
MNTEELIARMAGAPAPAPLNRGRMAAQFLAAVLVPVALFLLLAGTRPGLIAALENPVVALKTLLPALTFVLSFMALMRLTRPEAEARAPLRLLALPALTALGLLGLAVATLPPAGWIAEYTPFFIVECAGSILVLSIAPALVATRIFARGASPAPGLSAALAGLASASGAATGYSLFCAQDNPAFFVFWYGLAIATVTCAAALFTHRRFAW